MSAYRSEKAKAARQCTKNLRELLFGYRHLLAETLREEGLTLPQLRLLKAIEENGGVSGAAIARACHVTPQTLQAMLTRAVRERWIVREHSVRNQRIVTASLTRKGADVLAHGLDMAAQIEAKIWEGISAATLEQINSILDRGVANLHAGAEHQRAASRP